MGRIAIKLNPKKLTNPDLDLRYVIPDKIEELTSGKITNNGFDYLDDEVSSMVVFLNCSNPEEDVASVVEIIKNHAFLGNKLYETVDIYHSNKTDEELNACNDDLSLYLQVKE